MAQHAALVCCQGCIQQWHGIKKENEISDQEIRFLAELIIRWIEGQTGADEEFNQNTLSDLQGQLERITKKALAIGVRNDKTRKRYTYLNNNL